MAAQLLRQCVKVSSLRQHATSQGPENPPFPSPSSGIMDISKAAITSTASAANPDIAVGSSASVRKEDVLVYSAGYMGSLSVPNTFASRYNLAITLLTQSQPFESLMLLESLSGVGEVERRPHIWLRRAECCILHLHLLTSCLQNASGSEESPVASVVINGLIAQRIRVQ